MNNKYFKNLIIEISKSLKETLEESIGTLQLNKDESVLINTIFNELDNQIYIGNKVSYYDYKDIPQLSPYDTLYTLSYDIDKFNKNYNTNITWIKHLQVIVCENNNTYANAAALLDNDKFTVFTNDSILLATIVINNPEHHRFPKNHIAHELNHYYSEFKKYQKTSLYNIYPDLDINITIPHYAIDFANINIDKLIDNTANILSVFIECLYWLNESEIKAHIEDIFTELFNNKVNIANCKSIDELIKYSPTLLIYYNIDKVLRYFKYSLNDKQNEYINKRVVPILRQTVNRKRVSISYIYSKSFTKLKKIYKHINQICAYIKNNQFTNDK